MPTNFVVRKREGNRQFRRIKCRSDEEMKIYCDMTPESQNSPLLDNGSLKCVSAATNQRCQLLDNSSLEHVSVTTSGHAVVDELLGVVIYIRFAPSSKRGTRNWFESSDFSSVASRDSAFSSKRIQKFICGVLTSGQRKLKTWPIRKSEPCQSQ
jgi:hypothetical protein